MSTYGANPAAETGGPPGAIDAELVGLGLAGIEGVAVGDGLTLGPGPADVLGDGLGVPAGGELAGGELAGGEPGSVTGPPAQTVPSIRQCDGGPADPDEDSVTKPISTDLPAAMVAGGPAANGQSPAVGSADGPDSSPPTTRPTAPASPAPPPSAGRPSGVRSYAMRGGQVTLQVTSTKCALVAAAPAAGYSVQNWSSPGWLRVDFSARTREASSLICDWYQQAPTVTLGN